MIKITLKLFILITCSISLADEPTDLRISIEDGQVFSVRNSPRVIDRAVGFTSGYIARLQEVIGFNQRLNDHWGLRIENSRRLVPINENGILVVEETPVTVSFNRPVYQQVLDDFDINLNITGSARPSVKRFFVFPNTTERDLRDYERLEGPLGEEVLYGINDELCELLPNVRVDFTRCARYNNWTSRFTENLNFPFSAHAADEMEIGEGYSFSFEGVLAFGPSAFFMLPGEVSLSLYANFTKVIRSGRFEIIVVKTNPDKVLVSLRQARQVLNGEDFRISYGGRARLGLDLIVSSLETDSFFSPPTSFTLLEVNRTNELRHEERFNAVYEIDLNNPANRHVYNHALSRFDFSYLDVLTIDEISQNSNILRSFRNSDLRLVFEQNEQARINSTRTNVDILSIHDYDFSTQHEVSSGTWNVGGRSVQVASGESGYDDRRNSVLFGNEQDSFEFVAHEEFGPQARNSMEDIIVLAKMVIYDENTRRGEIRDYTTRMNYFLGSNDQLTFDLPHWSERNFETTTATMDFIITRENINRFQFLDIGWVKSMLLSSLQNFLSAGERNRLVVLAPEQWDLNYVSNSEARGLLADIKQFAIGFRDLQAALTLNNRLMASQAFQTMIQNSRRAQLYARLLRALILRTGQEPLINVTFANTRLRVDFRFQGFETSTFERDGLALAEHLTRVFDGRGLYEDLNGEVQDSREGQGSSLKVHFTFQNSFDGYIRLALKERNGSAYINRGEFIINLVDIAPTSYSLDIGRGNSIAESIIRSTLDFLYADREIELFYSLSYDGRIYSQETKL